MGVSVLIMGESGTGKSCSLRNFAENEISLINVASKPLPFRKKFEYMAKLEDAKEIIEMMKTAPTKTIVIDDSQYIMGFAEMHRRNEKGYQKFTDIGGNYFDIVDEIRKLPDDVIVYLLTHTETTSEGITKAKTSGQMLDKKITLEGLFTIVLRTEVRDGKYLFRTQNNGMDTVKSPMGMFASETIENDLKAVDAIIRQYYA